MSICPLDEMLQINNIFIDTFYENDGFHFLTHAHTDHMNGLSELFIGKIYCTEITRDLVMIHKNIPKKRFIVLKLDKIYQLNKDVEFVVVDSHHCDGSIMIVFTIQGNKILYTSDFRFHLEMKFNIHLKDIDRMFFDDTLDLINIPEFPTAKNSFEDITAEILNIREKYGYNTKIYINCQILGIEKIVRRISIYLRESFQISDNLLTTFRGKQLKYLLSDNIIEQSNLVLGARNMDNLKENIWIFPTSIHFLCLQQNKDFSENIPPNHIYIWFSTHPNKAEIIKLSNLCNALELIPCNYAITHLKCHDKK
jgi:hypothetical protein